MLADSSDSRSGGLAGSRTGLPGFLIAGGLIVVTLLALFLRGSGVDHQLPHRPDDDGLIVEQGRALREQFAGRGRPVVEPHYPLLMAGMLAALPPPTSPEPWSAPVESGDPRAV